MMRLPRFEYRAATSVDEAVQLLADHGSDAMLLAGGTDLLPNMKRRQQVPRVVVALRQVDQLREFRHGDGFHLGAGLTLAEIGRNKTLQAQVPALWQSTIQVATPHLRNMATLGGNVCLDTRCNYYDQNYEWRKSIDFCMKKDGKTCWVAPSSARCLAVSSTDIAPALLALRARLLLQGPDGERIIDAHQFFRNDGIDYLRRLPGELLTAVKIPDQSGWRSTYWKLRRRGSFDFPVLGVAAAAKLNDADQVTDAEITLGAVASQPMEAKEAAAALIGKKLTDETIQAAANLAFNVAKPMDNTDFALHWRKHVTRQFVQLALREIRGDDMAQERRRVAHHDLFAIF